MSTLNFGPGTWIWANSFIDFCEHWKLKVGYWKFEALNSEAKIQIINFHAFSYSAVKIFWLFPFKVRWNRLTSIKWKTTVVWHSHVCCAHGCNPGAPIKSPRPWSPYFSAMKILKTDEASKSRQTWPVDGDCSCQLPAVWSNCPCSTWILQVSLPAGSLFVQTARWTCQAAGARGRTPFSAPLDKESCWQAAAERQRHVCPFLRRSRPWKNNTNKIREQQRGPSRNYWWCAVPHRAPPFVAASRYGASRADLKNAQKTSVSWTIRATCQGLICGSVSSCMQLNFCWCKKTASLFVSPNNWGLIVFSALQLLWVSNDLLAICMGIRAIHVRLSVIKVNTFILNVWYWQNSLH